MDRHIHLHTYLCSGFTLSKLGLVTSTIILQQKNKFSDLLLTISQVKFLEMKLQRIKAATNVILFFDTKPKQSKCHISVSNGHLGGEKNATTYVCLGYSRPPPPFHVQMNV